MYFRITADEIEARMRQSVRTVVPCDLQKENPLCRELTEDEMYDAVVTTFTINCATRDEDEYLQVYPGKGVNCRIHRVVPNRFNYAASFKWKRKYFFESKG